MLFPEKDLVKYDELSKVDRRNYERALGYCLNEEVARLIVSVVKKTWPTYGHYYHTTGVRIYDKNDKRTEKSVRYHPLLIKAIAGYIHFQFPYPGPSFKKGVAIPVPSVEDITAIQIKTYFHKQLNEPSVDSETDDWYDPKYYDRVVANLPYESTGFTVSEVVELIKYYYSTLETKMRFTNISKTALYERWIVTSIAAEFTTPDRASRKALMVDKENLARIVVARVRGISLTELGKTTITIPTWLNLKEYETSLLKIKPSNPKASKTKELVPPGTTAVKIMSTQVLVNEMENMVRKMEQLKKSTAAVEKKTEASEERQVKIDHTLSNLKAIISAFNLKN